MNNNDEYFQISLSILNKFSRSLKFDIYVQRSESKFTKIFQKGDSIDWDRIDSYKNKGINFFFVSSDDYKIYSIFLERLGEYLNDSETKVSTSESIDILKELSSFTLNEIIKNISVNDRIVNNASNVVNGCIDVLGKNPKAMVEILKQVSSQKYILKHSMAVSLFSVMLAEASGIESPINISIIGLGAFLHDVGVGQLTFDPEDMKLLTPEQRKEMWRHPELGQQMVVNMKGIRSEVSQIILQHHEQPNGHGYPNGLKGPEIYHPAKIVSIADAFSAMISKRSFRDSMNVSEAVKRLVDLPGQFDKNLVATFRDMVLVPN